ncbi:putative glutamate receptor [Tachypleus tridentatus]|uniref:putative glutamate receptor n=1 Tax=Tachypleus tridentatus TaxID=6853 RepID=UPI003FD5E3A5
MHLRIAVEQWEPWIYVNETSKYDVTIDGPMAIVLKLLATSMNFTYNLKTPPDHEWGILANKRWTGMMGMLIQNEADVALGPFALSYDRYKAVEVTTPVMMSYTAILVNYQKPKPDAYSYIYALSWEVWIGLMASLIFVSLISLVSQHLISNKNSSSLTFLSFVDHFSVFYGSMFYQGSPENRNFHHQRVIRAFWWVSVIVLMQSFSGQLLATLVLSSDTQIDDLNDLNRLNILPVVEKGSHEHSVFKTDNNTLYRRLYTKMLEQSNLTFIPSKNLTADSILDLIKQGKIALVNDILTIKAALAKRFNSNRACGFYIAKERLSTNAFVMVLRKGLPSSLYKEVDNLLLRIVESGIVADSIENNVKDYVKCLGTEPELKPLSAEDLRGVFILLGCGLLISGTIFMVELIYHILHRKPGHL